VSEGFAVVVEVGRGAVPVLACGGLVGSGSDAVGYPIGGVATDVVDPLLAVLGAAVVKFEPGRSELGQLVAVAVEPVMAFVAVDVHLAF
jgi:hypothetical protein